MRLIQKALTFDDILLVPAYSEVLPKDVDLATQLTRTLRIKIPIVSAAMDTVTEARLAIPLHRKAESASSTKTCLSKPRLHKLLR